VFKSPTIRPHSNYLFGIFKLFLHWNIEEEQTTQWLKEKVQKDKHGSTKHTNKIKELMKQKLLQQGYVAPRLMPSLQNFYCRDHELADRYEISISQKTMFFFYLYVYRYAGER
jgi:hypothetical protein